MAEVGIYKLTNSEGEFISDLAKADITLRHPDEPDLIYDYTDLGVLGNGSYMLYGVNFSWRPVRLYINDVPQPFFGVQDVGNLRSVFISMDGVSISAASKKITDLAEGTTSTDAVRKSQLTDAFTALESYADNVLAEAKDYTDEAISNLPNLVAPQSTREVRFWEGATQVTGKIYNNLLYAVQYFDLSAGQYATVLIEGVVGSIYKAPDRCLSKETTLSNLTFKSTNREWAISFPEGVVNKIVTLENMKIFFGAGIYGGYSGATRQYTNFKLKDCEVYCYNNLYLYDGQYDNIKIYMASGKTLKFYGSGILNNVKSNVTIEFDAGFNGHKDYTDKHGNAFIPGGAMPTDPTTGTY